MIKQGEIFLGPFLFISLEWKINCVIRWRVEMNIACMIFIMYALPLNIQN